MCLSTCPSRAHISLLGAYPLDPKAVWLSSVRPLLQACSLSCCALSSSLAAPHSLVPCAAHLRGSHLRRATWLLIRLPPNPVSGYCACPFPHRRPRRAPSLPATLTCVAVTSITRSLVVRPSLNTFGRAADPPWLLWDLCRGASGLPLPSRTPTSMAGAGGARALRLATSSPTPMIGIDCPGLPSPLLYNYVPSVLKVSDVCCNYFILIL